MVVVKGLTKRYGSVVAVDNIEFNVEEGEIFGFLGPNGAGKTTTLRLIAGYIPASKGLVRVNGIDIASHPEKAKAVIGYMPETIGLYREMKVNEYLYFRALLKGMPGKAAKKEVERVVSLCDIEDRANSIIGVLSKGYKQRLGIADALLNSPKILILDEPTIGLDPEQIRHIRQVIASLKKQHTVIISSHILPEIEAVCDRVLIMHKGKVVALDTAENLKILVRGVVIEAEINPLQRSPEDVASAIKGIAGVKDVRWVDCADGTGYQNYVVSLETKEDIRHLVFGLAAKERWQLRSLRFSSPTLEDVFISIVKREEG